MAFAVVSAVVGLVLGGILWGVPLARAGLAEVVRDHDYEWDVYLGAASFASAGSLLAALVFLTSWRRLAT